MNDELQKAKALLARHGYAVIPREEVKSIGAFFHIPDRDLMIAAENDVLKHIRPNIFRALVGEMMHHDWVKIESRHEPERYGQTTYIGTMKIIPHKWEVDPFLEVIRRGER
jgi:hypothetical protein